MTQLRFLTTLLSLCFIFTAKQSQAQAGQPSYPGQFYTIEKQYPATYVDGYNLYVPDACTAESEAFPVIVFFQGGLGVGGKVEKLYNWGLPKLLKTTHNLDSELNQLLMNTFVHVMPHISRGQFYGNEAAIYEILHEVENTYNINPKKIYLTGLSRGGHGTWGVASRMPEKFAAIAPLAGAPHGVESYEGLADLPIWVSHNEGDGVVDYAGSRQAVAQIESLSGQSFHRTATVAEAQYQQNDRIFTSGPGDSHDSWNEMYQSVNFYKWLLRFQRP